MNRIKYNLAGITLIILLLNNYGQETKVTSDLRLVTEVNINKSLTKNFEIEIVAKSWLEKDISEFGEIDLEAAINYRLFKFLAAEIGYRWSKNKNKDDNFVANNRFSGSLDFIQKVKKFRFDYRICYQNIDDESFWENEDNKAKNILRNRIQIRYNLRKSKLEPFLLAEHYGRLFSENEYGFKIKFETGFSYKFNKHHELKVHYRIDRELNDKNPYLFFSVGLGYQFSF